MTNTYHPSKISSPGETLNDLLSGVDDCYFQFADRHFFSRRYFLAVLNGEAHMVPRLIKAICDEFGTDPIFWHNREKRYWDWKKKSLEQHTDLGDR